MALDTLLKRLGIGAAPPATGTTTDHPTNGRTPPMPLEAQEEKGEGAPPSHVSTSTTSTTSSSSGCPFGFGGPMIVESGSEPAAPQPLPPPLFGQKKVQLLYERYIHLDALRDVRNTFELDRCLSSSHRSRLTSLPPMHDRCGPAP